MTRVKSFFLIILFFVSASRILGSDLDGNGIADQNEQTLANMFCPCFVSHAPDQEVSPEAVEIMGTRSQDLWMRVVNDPGQCVYEKQVSEGDEFNPPVSSQHQALDEDTDYSWFTSETFDYVGYPPGKAYGAYDLAIHYEWAAQGNDPAAWRSAYLNEADHNDIKIPEFPLRRASTFLVF